MRASVLRIGLRIILAVSLLLNALVLGIVLRLANLRDDLGLQDTRLPREVRAAFTDRIDDDALRDAVRAVGTARRAMLEAASKRPFDEAAVEAAMEDTRKASAALQIEGQRVLMQAFKDAAK